MPPPQMTILDAPSREACIARRERTNTPLQALLLMNEPEYMKAARYCAWKTIADRSHPADNDRAEDCIQVIYESITSRLPDAGETKALLALVADLTRIYRENPALADQLCEGQQPPAGVTTAELAAWTMLVSSIYSLDITKTRE
jgi:hypothetical protein